MNSLLAGMLEANLPEGCALNSNNEGIWVRIFGSTLRLDLTGVNLDLQDDRKFFVDKFSISLKLV
ncbi:MAG: hypothetical protein AMJ91_07535 [candidate division Zixibacteria bacterium SM23_73_3]|nr:MAG: hypothetical protein AMJ91_07535 [candidate division Zixibacteria bacterium SM23_73_3]